MFFPGTPSIFVPGDSVFMLLRCMCNNILLEKKKKNTRSNGSESRHTPGIKGLSFYCKTGKSR